MKSVKYEKEKMVGQARNKSKKRGKKHKNDGVKNDGGEKNVKKKIFKKLLKWKASSEKKKKIYC